MSSSASRQGKSFESLFDLIQGLQIKPSTKNKRKHNVETPETREQTTEELAQALATTGLVQFENNMKHHHVKITVDLKGLPNVGDGSHLAVRPPADDQHIMQSPEDPSVFIGVYNQASVEAMQKQGYIEMEVLFMPPTVTIDDETISTIPSRLAEAQAARTASITAADASTRLPQLPVPESWWTDWYQQKTSTCREFIALWEGGADLSTMDGGMSRDYKLPPPKDNESVLKELGKTSRKAWNCGNTAYNNLKKVQIYQGDAALNKVLPWSTIRDKKLWQ